MATWIQRNVELRGVTGREKHENARRLFDALDGVLFCAGVSRVFFQRKPPDLRLRVRADDARATKRRLDRILRTECVPEGAIEAFFPSVYEPERRRFGGRRGMRAAHRFFHDDTALWLRLDRLDRLGLGTVPRDIFLAGVLNELCVEALGDPNEVWDVWSRYVEAMRLPKVHAIYPPIRAEDWFSLATDPEIELAMGYRAASRRLVEAIGRAEARGKLHVGRRAYLARLMLFTLNRHGLDPYWHARLGHGMARAWAPRG